LHELLSPHAVEVVVVLPPKREGPKNDERDALWLAEQLRLGAFAHSIFKAPSAWAGLRDAVRGYGMVTQDVVRVKNRLRAVYRSRGLHDLGDAIYDAEARKEVLARLPPNAQALAELFGRQLDALGELRDQAQQRLGEQAEPHGIVQRLARVPGLGPIRAAQIAAIVVTPHRFRTTRQFWSYCGLAVVTRSSADWKQTGGQWARAQVTQTRGLNRNRHGLLKAAFKGAALTVIAKMPHHPLHASYQRQVAAGTKPNLARLTLARRIAAIVLAMWKHEEAYDPSRQRLAQTA
jgi:transposase